MTPPDAAGRIEALALRRLTGTADRAVIGICGAQGSGKSTASAEAARRLARRGVPAAILSLDDLYLTRADRQALGRTVHPLLATRGVPGTHDVALGLAILDAIAAGEPVRLPRFDKAADDRLPPASWPVAADVRVLLFEGWCVGARPQGAAALAAPVNALEAEEDRDGVWRRHVDGRLAGDYQALFGRLDGLLLLAAPSFDVVAGWRGEQEGALRRRLAATGGDPARTLDGPALLRFVRHYERLTRHILATMPSYADDVLHLDARRRPRRNPRPAA